MPQYLLLLHDSPHLTEMSPAEMQSIVADYTAWRDGLVAEMRLVGANKLADEPGRHLWMDGGEVRVTDGPFAESKEVIGGYFLVSAEDYDEAVSIARRSPHLKYGGRIEVRELDRRHQQETD